jgi:DNA polymerase III epsilon subunit-like protein
MVKILVLDTETTDKTPTNIDKTLKYHEKQIIDELLLDKNTDHSMSQWKQWIQIWPYITQLSYIVYNTDEPTKSKIFNKYIDLPEDVQIKKESSKITNIYKSVEDARNKGIDPNAKGLIILKKIKETTPEKITSIKHAIEEFMSDFMDSQYVVAHNIDFDKKMILAELYRLNKLEHFKSVLNNNNFFCTMKNTINKFKIKGINGYGKIYYKLPKLSRSYKKIFGYEPNSESLHNALVDVVVCLRIFCKLGEPFNFDVCGTNVEITKLINSISPEKFKCKNIKIKNKNKNTFIGSKKTTKKLHYVKKTKNKKNSITRKLRS